MNYFYKDGKISRDRGRLIKVEGYNVYPVYHPAAALRSGAMMAAFKEDFLEIPKVLEMIKSGKIVDVNFDENEPTGDDSQLSLL